MHTGKDREAIWKSRSTFKRFSSVHGQSCNSEILQKAGNYSLSLRRGIQQFVYWSKNSKDYAQFYVHRVNILKTFCNYYYITLLKLLYGFGMDLLKLLHGFVKDIMCIFCPLPNKTMQKYDLDFEAN